MTNQLIDLLMSRRSIRSYTKEQVSKTDLDTILTCSIHAASANNSQPWHLIVVQDQDLLTRMNASVREAVLAKDPTSDFDEDENVFYHAPIAVFVCAKQGGGRADCGMLTQNMALAATALGIGSCVIGMAMYALLGKDGDAYQKELKVPEGFEPIYAVILGHTDDSPKAKPRDTSKISYL